MRLKFRDEASRLLLAALLFGAGSAAAQDYPPGAEAAVLSGWLSENTNIAPAAVVSVTSELVVALVGKTAPATTGGPLRLTLREEVIAPGYVQTVGGRSSLMSMELHCEERRIRMDERRLYSGINLTGAVETSEPSTEWVRIPDGSIMDEVARAACEAEYPWPLRFAEARPAAPGRVVAALDTPAPVLPPGPDARLIADEPAPVEEKIAEPPPAPEPDIVPPAEMAVEAASDVETPPPLQQEPQAAVVEPAITPEVAVSPEPEKAATPSPEQTVAVAEPAPEIPPPAETEQTPVAPTEAVAPPELSAPVIPPTNGEPQPPIQPPAEVAAAEIIPEPAPAPETPPPPPTGPVFAVQIGAYETREMAEDAWAALSANRPILVEGLSFEIRPVRVKGKDWLRGLVGRFATRREAGAFCTAIAGAEYGCILRTLAD